MEHNETWSIGVSAMDLHHISLRFTVDGTTKFSRLLTLNDADDFCRALEAEAKRNGTSVSIAREEGPVFQMWMSTKGIAELAKDLHVHICASRRFLAERHAQ